MLGPNDGEDKRTTTIIYADGKTQEREDDQEYIRTGELYSSMGHLQA